MITGFNTDVEHAGTIYHVQTEDKGLDSPLILSLVYVGGAILASKRSRYDDLISKGFDERELSDRLNRQHKLICAAIRAGRIDDLKRMSQREPGAAIAQPEPAESAPAVTAPPPVPPEPVQPAATIKQTETAETTQTAKTPKPAQTTRTAQAAQTAKPVKPAPAKAPPAIAESAPVQTKADAPAQAATPVPTLPPPSPAPPPVDTPAHAPVQPSLAPVGVVNEGKAKKTATAAPPKEKGVKQSMRAILQDVVSDFARAEAASGGGLHLSLIDEKEFRGGEMVTIRIRVGRGLDAVEPVAGADVTVKILGSTFRPLIFPTRTASDGIATVRAALPHFQTGRAALLVRVAAQGSEAELRRIILQG
jgi:hypothetical protein